MAQIGADRGGSEDRVGQCVKMTAISHAMSCCGSVVVALALVFPATPSVAAETFAGRTITISVPVAPGGGYDTYARLVAHHIRKHLPGQPTVIVKNMPGAGGIIAAGHLYTNAARDGTEFAVLQDANLFQQLTTNQQLPYDA